jgi:hypothetical protein
MVVAAAMGLLGAPVNAACILPTADGGDGPEPTKPTLVGQITDLRGSCFRVDSSRKGQNASRVCLARDASLFGVYGGDVEPTELRNGQHVQVWLENCQLPAKAATGRVVVMILASTKPGERFPR